MVNVTPFTGVWIEIVGEFKINKLIGGHTLHGCVD